MMRRKQKLPPLNVYQAPMRIKMKIGLDYSKNENIKTLYLLVVEALHMVLVYWCGLRFSVFGFQFFKTRLN